MSSPTGQKQQRLLDADSATRKTFPMFSGLLAYFPDALAYVAWVSHQGNEKHNPGEPLHHARGKSTDHADCIVRHVTRHGEFDGEVRESGALAWRALALLQEELEQAHGFPLPRGARAAAGEIVELQDRTATRITEETKFGFTVGDTVNGVGIPPNESPGIVVGFTEDGVKLRWPRTSADAYHVWEPKDIVRVTTPSETKFGFTVGETVNAKDCHIGENPGEVVGFTESKVNVCWRRLSAAGHYASWFPEHLRHGA